METSLRCYRRSPGADVSLLTSEAIDLPQLTREVGEAGLGGTVVFLGTVRRSAEDGPVIAIDYSSYGEMAEREFEKILAEARRRWPASRVRARHRIGRVETGETSVAIVAASPHRAEAFDVGRFVIEEVKRRVPVWKQEIFEGGSRAWRSAYDSTGAGGHAMPPGSRATAPGSE